MTQSRTLAILLLLIHLIHLNACESRKPNPAPLEVRKEISTQQIRLFPPPQHHFNLKAPQSLKQNGDALQIQSLPNVITLDRSNLKSKADIEGVLMVCDEAETYCKPIRLKLKVD